jgi:hypothetical protein
MTSGTYNCDERFRLYRISAELEIYAFVNELEGEISLISY